MKIKIAPSILSADFSRLQEEVDKVRNADYLHLDIMDGHFVPNITMGPAIIKCIKTDLFKDAHLMIDEPEKYAEAFIKAGAQNITFHAEVTEDCRKTAELIRGLGAKASVTINPDKPVSMIRDCLDHIDMVLIMSVYPGFGGQKFIPKVLDKVREIRKLKPDLDIEIDGGINDETIVEAVRAGANVIVAGSHIFKDKDPGAAVERLRKIAEKA